MKEAFEDIFRRETLIKAVFGGRRRKSDSVRKAVVGPVMLQGKLMYQVERHQDKKVLHENLSTRQAAEECLRLVTEDFKQVDIFCTDCDIQILAAKPEKPRISRKAASKCAPESLEHNRNKKYCIPDGEPCDFLIRLGVMSPDGKVHPKHYSKFRQINRFLEIVDDCYEDLTADGDRPLRIIDFGCGKAYLTFALYHYLYTLRKRNVEIIGLDLKEDVIEFCAGIAADLGYDHLHFQVGDIAEYNGKSADMVVTLHACDTATDYALINAVNWGSSVILSVPCCQHELFDQIENKLHQPMYRHGILKERFTEIYTDGLRGLKLEAAGYEVAMIEFTSLEHTARNIMIKAIRQKKPSLKACSRAQKEYEKLRDEYQVKPSIDPLPMLR